MICLEEVRKKSGMRLEDMAAVLNCSIPKAMQLQGEPWDMKIGQYINLYHALGTDSKVMLRALLDERLD